MPFCLISEIISPEVINIAIRREAELNITLPRINNFDIKQKKAWNFYFIICTNLTNKFFK